jgi:HlyD family secretion protein
VKRKGFAWLIVALIVFSVGGIGYFTFSAASGDSNQEQTASAPEIQRAVARIGNLILSISGSGELVPLSEEGLGFQEQGELVALNVKVGDQVQAGDVLARLKIDQTPTERAAALASAELEVLRAQQNLDQIYQNAQVATAGALLAVEEAQQAVDDLENNDLEQALAEQEFYQAEEAVQEAEMNLYIVNSSPSQQAIDTAYASLLFKEKELKEIQDHLAQVEYQFKSAPNKMVRDRLDQEILNLRVQLANQQLEYEKALYKYNTLDDPPEAIDLSVAEARLKTAQAQLAEAQINWQETQTGSQPGELALAKAQLTEAKAEWERLKNGPDPDEINLAEAQLSEAEASLATIQDGQLTLDLVAPTDGTVLSVSADIGDRINNEIILNLADLSQLTVEVYLDEVDSADVKVGDRAVVIFDALPDLSLQGQVVQIDPSLVRVGNSQAVRTLVILDALPNELLTLPLGLNATVDITTEEAANAVLVSIDALHRNADGSYFVYVFEGEALESRLVHVGLMDATTAEIIAGLQAGEEVAIRNLNLDQE